ncbi:helix-hairpin-helix domain-containing protein [Candidatus Bipolaricaulota bacterium]|nr:helix-hairpin-helix domain-containing protein [Candidatus Bipolaricaulota bacterium]MBS3814534.1 helix-hairpin-helix domain-containing protein [Candidatus Bipolaricaulota bacterium]MBS3825736.1 helix-hairpin-helix domain-containing protein [Candidatus Bipolaricaulota bacterium]
MEFYLKKSDRIILLVGICVGLVAVSQPYLSSFLRLGSENADLKEVNEKPIKLEGVKVKLPEISQGRSEINVNTAGAEKLTELPGIGPVLADRITEHREESGEFTSVEELKNVSGIGPSKLDQIKSLVEL